MLKSVITATLLLACSPALAQAQPAGQQQTPAAKPKPDTKRLVCHDESVIGSRVATTHICMTAEQWKQREQDAREGTAQQQRQSYTAGYPG
jgi:hypothetical protein